MGAEGAISHRGSIFASSTLREQQNNSRGKIPLPVSAPPPTQTPQGQPCLTGVGNNPLIVINHSQRTVSRMPKARRSRLSLTRCAGCATLATCIPQSRAVTQPQKPPMKGAGLAVFSFFNCANGGASLTQPPAMPAAISDEPNAHAIQKSGWIHAPSA